MVRGQRRRGLLVRLLVARGAPVSSEVLIDDVWDGVSPPGAASTLQSHVSLLRRDLGDLLQRTPGGYRLVVGHDEFDVSVFEADARLGQQAVRSGDHAGAVEVLGQALSRWRGPALADVSRAGWAAGEIARLGELRVSVREVWFEARSAVGGDGRLVAELEAAVGERVERATPTAGSSRVAAYEPALQRRRRSAGMGSAKTMLYGWLGRDRKARYDRGRSEGTMTP